MWHKIKKTGYTKHAIHMSPRWGLGYWKMSPGYKHTAPLGLNAQVFYVATPGAHSAPLEHIARTCRHAIDISLRWSENTHVAPLGLGLLGDVARL